MEPNSQPSGNTTPSSSQGTTPNENNPFSVSPPEDNLTPAVTPSADGQAAPAAAPAVPPAVPGAEPPQADAPDGTPSQTTPAAQPSGATPQPPAVSKDTQAIIDAIAASRNNRTPPQAGQPRPEPAPMTPEQFNKAYGIPTLAEADYESIIGVAPDRPERVQALNKALQSVIRPAVMMARDLAEARISEIEQRYQPMVQMYHNEMNRRADTEFYAKNPDLKGYEDLVKEIRDAHIARKQTFASQQEAFKAVADAARQILKKTQPNGAPAQTPAGGQSQQPVARPPARVMTPSAQGGRGGTPSAANSKPIAQQIFE